jgi:transposase
MAEPTYEELREENARLKGRVAELERAVEDLRALVEQLRQELEKSQRAAKRQAAPFSKRTPKATPKRPGRKPGPDYGRHEFRRPPDEGEIDEIHEASLPEQCSDCGGAVCETRCQPQFQVDLPRRPIHRQFNVHFGRCQGCGQAVHGRHPLMTSQAVGAAGSGLGSNAQAAAVFLNKRLGVSYGKMAELFAKVFGIQVTRGALVQIVLRSGRKCEPAYEQIRQSVRGSPSVVPDETGWRINGGPAWLHVLVGRDATCYEVARNRGGEVAAGVLGRDYSGRLIRDGWSPYDSFEHARHQMCLDHPLRRCRRLLETATRGAVHFPRAVIDVFTAALRVRDRHQAGEISTHGRFVAAGRLRERLRRLVTPVKTHAANERLAMHLESYLPHWFTFLRVPGLDATNWRAEQAIRPAVVNRKVWGGNRTLNGARAQSVLMSVSTTCYQQAHDPLTFLRNVLCSPSRCLLPLEGR